MEDFEYIKTFSGTILGSVKTLPNGDKEVRNYPEQRILSYYRKSLNRTTDFYGSVFSTGDTAVAFLFLDKSR